MDADQLISERDISLVAATIETYKIDPGSSYRVNKAKEMIGGIVDGSMVTDAYIQCWLRADNRKQLNLMKPNDRQLIALHPELSALFQATQAVIPASKKKKPTADELIGHAQVVAEY